MEDFRAVMDYEEEEWIELEEQYFTIKELISLYGDYRKGVLKWLLI